MHVSQSLKYMDVLHSHSKSFICPTEGNSAGDQRGYDYLLVLFSCDYVMFPVIHQQ